LRVAVVGAGAVGGRVARNLAAEPDVESVTVVHRDPGMIAGLIQELESKVSLRHGGVEEVPPSDVTVLAVPTGNRRAAEVALGHGSHVVSCADDPTEVRQLLACDRLARTLDRSVCVGVAMAPGVGCALAGYLRGSFDRVEEIHVASMGTGGPACARRHHAALTSLAFDWEDGEWRRRPGGSGRELVWFPEPVGGADCYRAGLADPLLLVPAFADARRVTARLEATRRDRLTSWMPMMRRPHPEGLVGAVRVEMRGWVAGQAHTSIVGVAAAPAVAASAACTLAAVWAGRGLLARSGAGGLAEMVATPGLFLKDLASMGLRVTSFEGHPSLL
jgi:saccharopine dehydrogenase-like NADP-dependent oxidoreductase